MSALRPPAGRRARRGFTLIEMMITLSIFGVIGYALVGAVDMGNRSSQQVIRKANGNSDLRRSVSDLTDELAMTAAGSIGVTTLPDGNHQLEFVEPITVAGVRAWGVDEPFIGVNADWYLRYTVEVVNQGGTASRRLVRQVLDDADAIRGSRVAVAGLRDGSPDQEGFTCVLAGDVWVLTIRTEGNQSESQGKEMVFHVRVRN